MIAIKLPILNNDEHKERLFQVARQHNNVVRFCYNRYVDDSSLSDTAINRIAKSTLKNIPDIDGAWIYNCRIQAKAIFQSSQKTKSKFRSGGFNAIKKRKNGTMTKQELKELRNSTIKWVGSKNHNGNRKFKIDPELKFIDFLITKNERYKLQLPKLHGHHLKHLSALAQKAKLNEISFACEYNVVKGYAVISFDLDELYSKPSYKLIKDRTLGIDLNPNQICISINDKNKTILRKSFILKNLQNANRNKYKHELFEITKSITRLAVHYQVEVVAVEELKMKSKDHCKGKNFNRLVNNFWIKKAFVENLKKRCDIQGVHFQEVAPQYSSFIGQLQNPNEENGIAASMEIARRGFLFYSIFVIKRINKEPVMFPKLDKGFLITRWKKFKEVIQPCRSWVQLYQLVKNMGKSYRVSLKDLSKDRFRVLRFKSRRSCCETIVYT